MGTSGCRQTAWRRPDLGRLVIILNWVSLVGAPQCVWDSASVSPSKCRWPRPAADVADVAAGDHPQVRINSSSTGDQTPQLSHLDGARPRVVLSIGEPPAGVGDPARWGESEPRVCGRGHLDAHDGPDRDGDLFDPGAFDRLGAAHRSAATRAGVEHLR